MAKMYIHTTKVTGRGQFPKVVATNRATAVKASFKLLKADREGYFGTCFDMITVVCAGEAD